MKKFFLAFRVSPTARNKQHDMVEGAIASCIVLENSPENALNKASFFIRKQEWEINSLETAPSEVEEADFLRKDIGHELLLRALKDKIAIFYAAWSRDKKTTMGPMELESTSDFNLNEYINNQKSLRRKGRCLHYDNGEECGDIINAHSIQKGGLLSLIADEGHVYAVSLDIGALKKNDGQVSYEKIGVNKVSTFLGFCGKHDNDLFECIDNAPLSPESKQVFLYAYRSLCREFFVKENALDLLTNQETQIVNGGIKDFMQGMKQGTALGLRNLKRHKLEFDKSLQSASFSDIQYVLFISEKDINMAFSGLFYPDFDFMGHPLQNLADSKTPFDLITICSCPLENGWGFLFAWHKTSNNVCTQLMNSLAASVKENRNTGDTLFRLVVLACENIAISPKWWEGLSSEQRNQISQHASGTASVFSRTNPQYLMQGLEGISQWSFTQVKFSEDNIDAN